MTCSETEKLIHAYLDGELDLGASLEIERHLDTCSACFGTSERFRAVRIAVRQNATYYEASGQLQRRVRRSVRSAARPGSVLQRVRWPRQVTLAAAAFAVLLLAAMFMIRIIPSSQGGTVSDQVLQSHIRSLLANHLTDVPSSDQHTVKPWFDGKTDFSPVVKDLATEGFPLIGGRLDYIDDQPVAAIVYRRRQHMINLFTWISSAGGGQGSNITTNRGYNLIEWSRAGTVYYAVSDLNLAELQEFVRMLQE